MFNCRRGFDYSPLLSNSIIIVKKKGDFFISIGEIYHAINLIPKI
jgi:hypothetical protein